MKTELLVRAARALVDKVEDKDIDMGNFGGVFVEGMPSQSRCFGGWCPYLGIKELEPVDSDFLINRDTGFLAFVRYTKRVFDSTDHKTWDFIFGNNWPNSTKEILERALHLQEHDTPESEYGGYSNHDGDWEPKTSLAKNN